VDDTSDYVAVTSLQARYGDAVTRRAWTELESMFRPDCALRLDLRGDAPIEKVGPEAISTFIAASIERFEFFLFTVMNTVVDVAPDRRTAEGRLYIRELRQERDTQRWTTAYGLYQDTYANDEGRWLFAERRYSSLARTSSGGAGMDVFPIPGR
jgi:hypothetical protein